MLPDIKKTSKVWNKSDFNGINKNGRRRNKKNFNNNELIKKDRIAKRLAILGFESRRNAEKLVMDGKVKVNGVVCTDLSLLVGYDDKIFVNGKEVINKPIRTQIFIMNKPSGYITTNNDPQGRRTVFELIPSKFGRLITVGRLDFNTEGLLLLTNNGELARLMEMPATALKRVYYAKVVGDINDGVKNKLTDLRNGIKIEGTEYGKMIVEIEDCSQTKATLRIVIFEGKNNEIRRIMWHLGLKVVKLTRVQYGVFRLKGLPSGCIQESRIKVDIRELEKTANRNAKRYNLSRQNNTGSNVEKIKEVQKKQSDIHDMQTESVVENDKNQESEMGQNNQQC